MLEKNGWIVDGGVWLLLFIMRNQQLPEVQWQVADDGEDDGEGDGVDEMKWLCYTTEVDLEKKKGWKSQPPSQLNSKLKL